MIQILSISTIQEDGITSKSTVGVNGVSVKTSFMNTTESQYQDSLADELSRLKRNTQQYNNKQSEGLEMLDSNSTQLKTNPNCCLINCYQSYRFTKEINIQLGTACVSQFKSKPEKKFSIIQTRLKLKRGNKFLNIQNTG